MASNVPIPAAWQDAAILDGLDIEDKSKLIGVPFLITGCEFKTNASGVQTVYVDAEYTDGTGFTFTDSSTGVRLQIIAFLQEIGKEAVVDTGDYVAFRLVSPNGLRVSEYPNPNPRQARGNATMVKTYYLTTSGRRAGREQAQKAATATRQTRTPK